jgi:phosphatidylglycerophosphate synthase
MEEYKKRILTIPNIVTLMGIIAVVFYTKAFLAGDRFMITIAICVAAFSDLFDGMLARRLNQCSELGAVLDPLRDRLLLLAVAGNLLWIYGIGVLAGYVGLAILSEVLFNIINLFSLGLSKREVLRLKFRHTVGKIRQASHITMIFCIVANYYYIDPILKNGFQYLFIKISPTTLYIPLEWMTMVMAYGSLLNLAAGVVVMFYVIAKKYLPAK